MPEPMLKSQTVRLLDVAVIGPVMLIAAYALRRKPLLAGPLAFFGATTVVYNAYNYQRYNKGILPGGYAEGLTPSDFDPVELERGTRIELEHTPSRRIAQEIAMDHLAEDPRYYEKLATLNL